MSPKCYLSVSIQVADFCDYTIVLHWYLISQVFNCTILAKSISWGFIFSISTHKYEKRALNFVI